MHIVDARLTVPGRLVAAALFVLSYLIPAGSTSFSTAPAASSPAPAAYVAAATPDVRTVAWRFTGQIGRPGCRVERVAEMCSRFAPGPVDIAHINVRRRDGVGTRLVSDTNHSGLRHYPRRAWSRPLVEPAAWSAVLRRGCVPRGWVGFSRRTDVPSAAASAQPATGTR